jgi:WD40 repeat protein
MKGTTFVLPRADRMPIRSMALTPPGTHAVAGRFDGRLQIWHLGTMRTVLTPAGHGWEVTALALLPDGRRMVSAGRDKLLKVWDLSNGSELLTLSGHTDEVWQVFALPDGWRAASSGWDGTIRVWDVNQGLELYRLPDGGRLVAVSSGLQAISVQAETLMLWDLDQGTALGTVSTQGLLIEKIIYLDQHHALWISSDGILRLWDVEQRTSLAGFGGDSGFFDFAIAPDGTTVVAGDRLGHIHVIKLEGWKHEA